MIAKPLSDPPACATDILALQDTLEIIGGKWTLLIVHYLLSRRQEINTFTKIEQDIPGLSAKVLSKELKILELNKLIIREAFRTKPVTVKYAISEYGKSLESIISMLVNWGQEHRNVIFGKK
ncbi:winged helix-turn-helix transcriptional regulator [Sphingobacterium bovistauri]|uniref:Helix-turn-helix transcriptional regulator n=1 Tax=Sphingobacterium bovistauri TaxID=2781959 RepID=A0ABS7Z3B2_9SPHI|nr:helix-turn-helix domain-containing protein [Sphingobacterium bovistauri]MCA5004610.1 helix-turn-helix transcriptional regulator [Sphingobacterium bovistauri]